MEELMLINRRQNAENLRLRAENRLWKILCVLCWGCWIVSEAAVIYMTR